MTNETDKSVHDPRISQTYQGLDKPTPPAGLDDRILAAARREVGAGPRKASFSRRWAVPISAAAVLVLSVSLITLQYSRQSPDERTAPQPATVIAPQSVPLSKEQQTGDRAKTEEAPQTYRELAPDRASQPADNMLGEEEVTPAVQKEKRIAPVQRQDAAERLSANQQIEQIKQLLSEGKKKEAIAAFESFRQRYPDYKLDPELEKRLD
ncbi:MAG: hypothetical protein LJE74_08225 [Proteobacteria bacterium]|jgi:hypothetical protein|nr:hypothetical protein [Pseudomonadota bacterium]